ncbi:MAG TPA: hypothetical protein VFV99_28235, partial [Kofleriaceae bacterium]|nr:hypothetical protein [Kofleriaceae bacterium]
MRPAVIPKLSELPTERERRNAILDSSHAEPGPENRPTSKKARKAEAAAATAAAVIGVLFSNHANVTLGGAATIDENELFEDTKKHKPAQGEAGGDEEKETDPPPEP